MRALLFLSVVGTVLYGLLLLTSVPEEEVRTGLAQTNAPTARSLGSWGPYLPAALIERRASDRFRGVEQKPRHDPVPLPEPKMQVKAETLKAHDLRVVQVALAARVHSMPSLSSPAVAHFNAGTHVQVLNQQNGWAELINPATQERGWIIDNFVHLDEDLLTRTATLPQEKLSKPQVAVPAALASKQVSRPAKAGPQSARKFVTKSKRSRLQTAVNDERPPRLGLFGRRFALFGKAR